jgi:hypothetical protein
MSEESVSGIIRSMITDDEGNYLLGIENGITTEKVLNKLGYKINSTDPLVWYKKYVQVGSEIGRIMKEVMSMGYVAGGMSRVPTYYYIAREGNRKEEGYILQKKIKNTKGRLKSIQSAGKNMIDPKKIGTTIRLLTKIDDEISVENEQQSLAEI